jgi:hypothetical protein
MELEYYSKALSMRKQAKALGDLSNSILMSPDSGTGLFEDVHSGVLHVGNFEISTLLEWMFAHARIRTREESVLESFS